MKIHLCRDKLPEDKQWVFAYFPTRPWMDSEAPNGEYKWAVVKFIQGISEEERYQMEGRYERANYFCSEDEWSNNTVPYFWKSFGATTFFGQEAYCWMRIPIMIEEYL